MPPLNVGDLMDDRFINRHSGFPTLRDFFRECPVPMSAALLTDAPQEPSLEDYVRENTVFPSWACMLIEALDDYLKRTYG